MAYGSSDSSRQIDKLRSDVDGLNVRVAVLQDRKASGTAGGSSSSSLTADTTLLTADMTEYTADMTYGGMLPREITVVSSDDSEIIELLAGNTFTLLPGRYLIRAYSVFHYTDLTRLQIWDALAEEAVGNSLNGYFASTVQGHLVADAIVEPRKKTPYRLKRQCERSTVDGLGKACGFGIPEIYTTVEVVRLNHLKL